MGLRGVQVVYTCAHTHSGLRRAVSCTIWGKKRRRGCELWATLSLFHLSFLPQKDSCTCEASQVLHCLQNVNWLFNQYSNDPQLVLNNLDLIIVILAISENKTLLIKLAAGGSYIAKEKSETQTLNLSKLILEKKRKKDNYRKIIVQSVSSKHPSYSFTDQLT